MYICYSWYGSVEDNCMLIMRNVRFSGEEYVPIVQLARLSSGQICTHGITVYASL